MKIQPGYVRALNTLSGQIAIVSEQTFNHPVVGKYMIQVDENKKSYSPDFYQPKTPQEYLAQRFGKTPDPDEAPETPDDEPVEDEDEGDDNEEDAD